MKYQNNNTFRITLMYFVILFLGIICMPTAHALNQNYSFVTQWNEKTLCGAPNGIASDSSGNIYATDPSNSQINKFDNSGKPIGAFKTVITKIDQDSNGNIFTYTCSPYSIAIDSLGNMYVTNPSNTTYENGNPFKLSNSIEIFDSNGNYISSIANCGVKVAGDGLAVDSAGYIFVTGDASGWVKKYESNGNLIKEYIWNNGEHNGWLDGIAVDSSGNVFVADFIDGVILKFDNNLNSVAAWSQPNNYGQWTPYGIAVDSSNNFYVTDPENNYTLKFDNNCNLTTIWGSSGTGPGQFNKPAGIAINESSGNVSVADYGNQRIQVFAPAGSLNITKSASPTNYSYLGQPITYNYTVTNNGGIDITGPITVTDNITGTTTIPNSDLLAPGQNVTGQAIYKIQQSDLYAGNVTNLANATGYFTNSVGTFQVLSNNTTVTINTPGFLPNPNGYGFDNIATSTAPHTMQEFINIYNPQDGIANQLFDKNNLWFKNVFQFLSHPGNCFGMAASSLMLYNPEINPLNNFYHDKINNAYSYSKDDTVPPNWIQLTPFIFNPSPDPASVENWIRSYQTLQADASVLKADSANKAITGSQYIQIYNILENEITENGLIDMVLNLRFNDGKTGQPVDHTVAPYKTALSSDGLSGIIYVYDPNSQGAIDQYITINLNNGNSVYHIGGGYVIPYVMSLVRLDSINQQPQIPTYWTLIKNSFTLNEQLASFAHILYTDIFGQQLGYYKEIFYDQIPNTWAMVPLGDNGNNNNSTEFYYVPDPSIKMELYGNISGISEVDMGTPNGLIVANVTVSPNSVDEFKILNNGTGVYFNSENDTTPSLGLMLDVETPNQAQIVNANLSQIEKGGYINLSNNNGTITIQNNGLQRTGNFTIEQMTSGQNSSINLTNIVIEANSTVNIVPSNWNDIGNSTVTINDVGSNGQVYHTETITYQNGQVIPTPTTPAGILNNVIYVHPGKPAEFLNNVIDVPQTHSRNSEHDNDRHYASIDSDIVPVRTLIDSEPIPMMYGSPINNPMYSSPMYASVPGGYSSEPYGTIGTPNSDSNIHKAKAHLSKHKHHTNKHHKTGKNHSK